MRRLWLIAAAVLAATLTVPVIVRALERGSWWTVSQADQRRWDSLGADLGRRCSARVSVPQAADQRAAETADVHALLGIAAAHPAGRFPFELDPSVQVPMATMVRSIQTVVACPRPDLVALVRRVAAALPDPPRGDGLRPAQEVAFTRASAAMQDRCRQPQSGAVVAAERRAVDDLIALDRAAPRAHVLARLGIEHPPASPSAPTPAVWIDLSACGAHGVAARLARAVGSTPAQPLG